jgi:hypothetical protein
MKAAEPLAPADPAHSIFILNIPIQTTPQKKPFDTETRCQKAH